jgi:membrane protease subunit (stomatin/prohibitin family)
MGLFGNQFANVVEWNESEPGVLFYKWPNQEIKKGSKLIIRPGQDAIFMYNGCTEGVFEAEGNYDIESQIIPFLTTLKSFKFAFNTPLRAEVLFINTKEILAKWGTKNAVNIPAQGLPGGMPIRAFGTYNCRVADRNTVINKLAGVKLKYTVDDVRERMDASVDQLLMSWIAKAGRDMFNLQADAAQIAKGIESDLNNDLSSIGIAISDFRIESFSYPEEVRKMQEKAAGQAMVGDIGRYQQIAAADGMNGANGGNSMAANMVGMQMGMAMGQQMVNQMQQNQAQQNQTQQNQTQQAGAAAAQGQAPKFCPQCGTPTNGAKFCSNCGAKLV